MFSIKRYGIMLDMLDTVSVFRWSMRIAFPSGIYDFLVENSRVSVVVLVASFQVINKMIGV